jgi:DNA polymerase
VVRLVLDLETTSTADLRKTGAHAYAEHPDTRITVLCYAIDDGPVQTLTDFRYQRGLDWRFNVAVNSGAIVVAHNYLFEFALYHAKLVPLGWPPIPLSQWSCTMARCLVAGYPASLELAGRAIGLTIQKDPTARDLMLRFARPRSLNPVTWWHETDPVRFQALCDYCVRDVATERELDTRVPELSPRERQVFELDHQINQRGLGIDQQLVLLLGGLVYEATIHLTAEIVRLTNGQVQSLNQVALLRAWLASRGVDTPDLRRETVRTLLADQSLTGPPRTALQARMDASRSSTAKLAAIAAARSRDGRVRGTFQYYGASRTGRWAGRRLQPQNLFRGSIKDVGAALRVIRAGASAPDLDMLFEDSAIGVVASCLRSTILAPFGFKLVVADLAQIEARVLAWLAGQMDALAVFRARQDIYTATANAIGSTNRQLGKVLVLACGFGMGHVRFQQTALTYGVVLDEWEALSAVTAWRSLNSHIVTFWWDSHRALLRVMRAGPGAAEKLGFVTFIRGNRVLLIRLPSGRHLVYRHPKIEQNEQGFDEFTYLGSLGGNWVRLRAWPGKLAENITQAVARDVMVEAMLVLARGKVPLIATIHDELIAEVSVDQADDTLDGMLLVMRQTPGWAKGLPVDAAGFIVQRYQKG